MDNHLCSPIPEYVGTYMYVTYTAHNAMNATDLLVNWHKLDESYDIIYYSHAKAIWPVNQHSKSNNIFVYVCVCVFDV